MIPPEVAAQLERLTNGLRELLHDDLVGVYVHGSLALGCFGPRSDVDVIAVSRRPATDEERGRLAALTEPPVEFHLLLERDLETWRHPLPFDYQEGRRGVDHDLAAHLTIVRAAGIALHGPPAREVFPPVPPADYADALRRDVDWCLEHFDKPRYQVLSLARTWATLVTGDIHSKVTGAEWALPRLPEHLRPSLEHALAAYGGAPEEWDETLRRDYVDYLVREIRRR